MNLSDVHAITSYKAQANLHERLLMWQHNIPTGTTIWDLAMVAGSVISESLTTDGSSPRLLW